jgi:hypothetical protein
MIREAKEWDEQVVKAAEKLGKSKTKRLETDEWMEKQGFMLFRGRIYVPKDTELRCKIVKLYHESCITGHPGQWKTMELITRNYWWPGITRFVIEYIKGCDKCQRYKNHPELPTGKLKPLEVPSRPWKSISVDFIVKLPQAQGFDLILVTVCRATKQAHFTLTTEKISA